MVHEKSGTNIEKTADQIALLKTRAEQSVYTVHDVYCDDGISAKEAGARREFDRLLGDLASGHFRVILATEDSGLSRNKQREELTSPCLSRR